MNSRPQISRVASTNVSISDYVSYDWPLTAYLNFSRGVPSQLIGQYVCRSDEGNIIRNFLNGKLADIHLDPQISTRFKLWSITVPLFVFVFHIFILKVENW